MNLSAKKSIFALASSMIMASTYFIIGESTIDKDSNCVYLSPWTTDLMAWLFGLGVCYYGFKYSEPVLVFLGGSVATLHVAQFAAHKVLTRE
tara:strand:- start:1580 stop:1855 length:276 start_codon:yes stop_codon:yes gene_type:complete